MAAAITGVRTPHLINLRKRIEKTNGVGASAYASLDSSLLDFV